MSIIIKIESLYKLSDGVKELIGLLDLNKTKHPVNCLAFYGEMGAGKTTIIKEVCVALQVKDNISSPTFSLVNEYLTINNQKIYHFDFYRINQREEAFDLGYEEYFYSNNLCLIEWPEKIESLIPQPYYKIEISISENEHRILKIEQIG